MTFEEKYLTVYNMFVDCFFLTTVLAFNPQLKGNTKLAFNLQITHEKRISSAQRQFSIYCKLQP